MTTEPHHEAVRHRPRRIAGGVPRLPWRTLRNPFRPLEVVSADELEAIHRASLRILEEIGVECLGDRTLDGSHLLPAVRGDLLHKLGRLDEAREQFERAASLTRNARERDVLLDRAAGCARRAT